MFCPLDCWDACKLKMENGKWRIKGEGFTPYLCWKLNNYFKFPREISSKLDSKNIMLSNGLKILSNILKHTNPKRILFIKGSGNMGFMQNVTKLFFEKYGATFAIGSTCDGLGEEGIIKAIGKSLILPTDIIKNSKNIVLWGRNAFVTNTHLLPLIKDKSLTVIDVRFCESAKFTNKFIQVKVNKDYYLALMLSRIVIESKNFNSNGNNFEKFKNIVFSKSLEEYSDLSGVSIEDAYYLLEKMKEGASVLLGLGVAKCKECYKTTWAIFSLMKLLDYFGKNNRGVAFLGSSGHGIYNPFKVNHKNKVNLFDINPDDYDVVFIQGANPLKSFVGNWEWIKEKKLIVFGKYYDETAQNAYLFIPTKDFYEKIDIRGSYFHEFVLTNENPLLSSKGISEYELTKYLFDEFGFDGLKSEKEYLNEILNGLEKIDKEFYKNPHQRGYSGEEEFNFLDEEFNYKEKEFEIVTYKYKKALNSQFAQDETIYINSNSKNIMLSWIKQNLLNLKIKYINTLPKNTIFTSNRKINKFLKAKGENVYYEI